MNYILYFLGYIACFAFLEFIQIKPSSAIDPVLKMSISRKMMLGMCCFEASGFAAMHWLFMNLYASWLTNKPRVVLLSFGINLCAGIGLALFVAASL